MTPTNNHVRYPNIHVLLYGESGSGKTTFWSTAIKYYWQTFKYPSLVFQFDPWDKATPYLELGETVMVNTDPFYDTLGVTAKDVFDKDGNLIVRVEFYCDPIPEDPHAIDAFGRRMIGFEKECRSWATVGVDSMTFFERASIQRWKKLNPLDSAKQHSNLSWYGGVKEDGANLLMSRTCWWDTNVGVLCHIGKDKDEFADMGMMKGLALVGDLAKKAGGGFGEMYRMKVINGQQGRHKRVLQTQSDGMWNCNSVVTKAPDPCEPEYVALWSNWAKGRS